MGARRPIRPRPKFALGDVIVGLGPIMTETAVRQEVAPPPYGRGRPPPYPDRRGRLTVRMHVSLRPLKAPLRQVPVEHLIRYRRYLLPTLEGQHPQPEP